MPHQTTTNANTTNFMFVYSLFMQMTSSTLVLLRRIHSDLKAFSRSSYCRDVLSVKMACADIEEGILRLEKYEPLLPTISEPVVVSENAKSGEEIASLSSLIKSKDALPQWMIDVVRRGSTAPETLTHREVAQMAFILEACLALSVD